MIASQYQSLYGSSSKLCGMLSERPVGLDIFSLDQLLPRTGNIQWEDLEHTAHPHILLGCVMDGAVRYFTNTTGVAVPGPF